MKTPMLEFIELLESNGTLTEKDLLLKVSFMAKERDHITMAYDQGHEDCDNEMLGKTYYKQKYKFNQGEKVKRSVASKDQSR